MNETNPVKTRSLQAKTGSLSGEKELGAQPLDALMTRLGLSNHDLVEVSTEQLTHKMVSKGRKGRRLTPNVKTKILHAFHAALKKRRTSSVATQLDGPDQKFAHRDLFNY